MPPPPASAYEDLEGPPEVPPRPTPPPEAFTRTGEGWDEQQWLAKAMELMETFSGGASANLSRNSGKKPPLPPQTPTRETQTSKATALKYRSAEGRLVEVNLLEALEHHGLDVLPDWYSSLDRVYEVRDMAHCQAPIESPVPISGLLGAPGHSYVVSGKAQRSRYGSSHSTEDVPPDEETIRRHAGRVVATSLPGHSQSRPGMAR